jgi:nucleoid DNA-binding protein/LysM repeat protein
MNEKFTLQELAEQLARRHDMNPEDAEAFVGLFFTLIKEALETDKYVKVKGLGTFKLIGVEARESVSVNSGERIEIQGYSRISFTPDASMRDWVNRPFSHFETVVLNEGTHFDDMEEEEGTSVLSAEMSADLEEGTAETEALPEEPSESPEQESKEEVPQATSPVSESAEETDETVPVEEGDSVDEPAAAGEPAAPETETVALPDSREPEPEPLVEADAQEAAPVIQGHESSSGTGSEEPVMETGHPEQLPVAETGRKRRFPWCMLATVMLAGVLIGGGMVWSFLSDKRFISEHLLDSLFAVTQKASVAARQELPAVTADTVAAATASQADTVRKEVKKEVTVTLPEKPSTTVAPKQPEQPAAGTTKEAGKTTPERRETLSDTVEYQITGTQASYTIRPGESLVKISQKFYGNKKLWPYLVKHNPTVIRNANQIPIGATIQIPVLTPKKDRQ